MTQRVVRVALVAGVLVLALLLLLATCGGTSGGKKKPGPTKPPKKSAATLTRVPVPSAYTGDRGWEVVGASPEYAVARVADAVGYLERVSATRFRLRAVDAATGRTRWMGDAWRPLSDPTYFPHVLAVTKDGREFFATWSYGKIGEDALTAADMIVALDVYDVESGTQQRIEIPWADDPTVNGTGPGILISDGGADSAVVDPVTGRVTKAAPKDLRYPAGCRACRVQTEVRSVTGKGLLVSGRREFWVRGGWHSRKTAPAGADAASGVPTAVTGGHVLAKWQKKKDRDHDIWAVHDAETGKTLATAECRKPAIEPGKYPAAALSPEGRYLVAGSLGFDLESKTGHCFEDSDGAKPMSLSLETVTDAGVAYGTTATRTPVEADLATREPTALPANIQLPATELSSTALFRWTDRKDRDHLIAYARRK
ncbi:hypothetical protein J7I98_35285 [Streptomyces sp. ISL-98]|uniref:hypothetical protein n=1 Tax=Streptomyces sp. ISL-98 TaxID=2819192 RepID=UPI001BE7BA7F|nr:hypothetical protein [Streptomyces sp. ISL-98]MBT2510994.1 hypothetical protein [Streptomyces sp. ISL-98]